MPNRYLTLTDALIHLDAPGNDTCIVAGSYYTRDELAAIKIVRDHLAARGIPDRRD